MIVKDQNTDNISIINDVTMNPMFLIVNKPIEYNSTVSISWKLKLLFEIDWLSQFYLF